MKLKMAVLGFFVVLLFANTAHAVSTVYHFKPSDSDIFDLDHYSYYSWGINFTLAPDEVITRARVYIKEINNWKVESDDILYVNLLDHARLGLRTFSDDQHGGNNFRNWGSDHILLDRFTDLDDYPGPAEFYNYRFSQAELGFLNDYIMNDGRFGLGFDADCHYWNEGVRFLFETQSMNAPEPATIVLLGSGLLGSLGYFRRKKA